MLARAMTMMCWLLTRRPPFWKWKGGNTNRNLLGVSSGFSAVPYLNILSQPMPWPVKFYNGNLNLRTFVAAISSMNNDILVVKLFYLFSVFCFVLASKRIETLLTYYYHNYYCCCCCCCYYYYYILLLLFFFLLLLIILAGLNGTLAITCPTLM